MNLLSDKNYRTDSLTETSESDSQPKWTACGLWDWIQLHMTKWSSRYIYSSPPSKQYLFPSPFTEVWYIESDSWCRNSRVTPDGGLTSSSRYVSPALTRTAKQISAQSACIRTQLSHIIQEIWSVCWDCGATFKLFTVKASKSTMNTGLVFSFRPHSERWFCYSKGRLLQSL